MKGPDWYLAILNQSRRTGEHVSWAQRMNDEDGFWPRMEAIDPRECHVLRLEVADILGEAVQSGPAADLARVVDQAVKPPAEPVQEQHLAKRRFAVRHHWPTSVAKLNERTMGGGYGQVVFSGTAKLGKSMLSMGSAIEAAGSGWKVLYLGGENSREDTEDAFYGYIGGDSDLLDRVLWNMRVWHVLDRGFTVQRAVMLMHEMLSDREADRLLVVVDSLNRITEMSSDGASDRGYWATMAAWGDYFRRCSWLSSGKISSLLVSEMNKDRVSKGRRHEYAASLVVNLTPVKGSNDAVEIAVAHSRSTPAGPLGVFVRDWPRRRFRGEWEENPPAELAAVPEPEDVEEPIW